jgi:hypothetical protein
VADNCHNDEPTCFEVMVPSLHAPNTTYIASAMKEKMFTVVSSHFKHLSFVVWLGVIGTIAGCAGAVFSSWFFVLIAAIVIATIAGAKMFFNKARRISSAIDGLSSGKVSYSISYREFLESLQSVIAGETKLRLVLDTPESAVDAANLIRLLLPKKMDGVTDEARKVYSILKGYDDA